MKGPRRTPPAPGRRPPRGGLRIWGTRHLQTLLYSLGQLTRRPVATLMTTAVIGIALALPAGLHLLLENARQVTHGWDGATRISLFLHRESGEQRALELADRLRAAPEIGAVRYISQGEALEEFRTLSGFGAALDVLEENPLPPVLVVSPQVGRDAGVGAVNALLERLRGLPEVEMAQLDLQWVKRLYAIMDIVRRGVWVLASLLAMAVLLVVGNTIRLAIQNRRDEIVITKLIGGTDAFIRRPFLYTGFWYGLFGGVIALLLLHLSVVLVQEPIRQLAGLYRSAFALQHLGAESAVILIGSGCLLGLLGSWLAVGRHLREIEPR